MRPPVLHRSCRTAQGYTVKCCLKKEKKKKEKRETKQQNKTEKEYQGSTLNDVSKYLKCIIPGHPKAF